MNLTNINQKTAFFMVQKWYLFLIVLSIFACNSDDDTTTPPNVPVENGFWLVEEKGWIFEFTDGQDIFYNFNSVGCTIQDTNFIPETYYGFILNQVNVDTIIGTSQLSDSEIIFKRMQNQNSLCLPDQIAITQDPKVNFDHFWNIFNDYYAFFEARNIDWAQYESLRDQVTTDNFYETLETLAYLLEDGHVSIVDDENAIDIDSGEPKLFERLNANLSGDFIIDNEDDFFELVNQKVETIALDYLNGAFEIDPSDNILWGQINEDVGYIIIATMEGYGTNFDNELSNLNETLDVIMNDLNASGVSKLIIDMRLNDGGIDTAALTMVSRFMDQERVLYSKKARLGNSYTENIAFSVGPRGDYQFTNDIVLLTSPYTISAAELFVLCLKDLPYVTIVGENTTGAFSTILEHTLPNGSQIGLSNEVYSDPQGAVFEITGIGPQNENNRIPFLASQDFQEGKDSGIDRALELLNN